jgi:hypothetical protein
MSVWEGNESEEEKEGKKEERSAKQRENDIVYK